MGDAQREVIYRMDTFCYTGWHTLCALLPKSVQTRIIAKAWMKEMTRAGGGAPLDLARTKLVLHLPWGAFRVVGPGGRVEPCAPARVPGTPGL